jgi:CBS domain-containing protein
VDALRAFEHTTADESKDSGGNACIPDLNSTVEEIASNHPMRNARPVETVTGCDTMHQNDRCVQLVCSVSPHFDVSTSNRRHVVGGLWYESDWRAVLRPQRAKGAAMTTIREVMQTESVTVRADSPLTLALELLIKHGISGLPVVDADDRIVGVLSEKDLLKVFYEKDVETVAGVMTPDPITVSIDDPLVDVFDCLMANDFRRVLVHERGRLVGLISRADLMPTLLEALLERSRRSG